MVKFGLYGVLSSESARVCAFGARTARSATRADGRGRAAQAPHRLGLVPGRRPGPGVPGSLVGVRPTPAPKDTMTTPGTAPDQPGPPGRPASTPVRERLLRR